MKIAGIILVVLGSLNFIGSLIGISSNPELADRLGRSLFMAIGFLGLGIYLINRANNKKKEQEEREKWNSGSDEK